MSDTGRDTRKRELLAQKNPEWCKKYLQMKVEKGEITLQSYQKELEEKSGELTREIAEYEQKIASLRKELARVNEEWTIVLKISLEQEETQRLDLQKQLQAKIASTQGALNNRESSLNDEQRSKYEKELQQLQEDLSTLNLQQFENDSKSNIPPPPSYEAHGARRKEGFGSRGNDRPGTQLDTL